MAKYTIIYTNGLIVKDDVGYDELDLSFLPSDVLAVQSSDGTTANIEKGNRSTETHTSEETGVATSSLSWWSNVDATWQAAHTEATLPPTDEDD